MKRMIALLATLVLLSNICVIAESTASVDGFLAPRDWYDLADCSALQGKRICVAVQSLQNSYWTGVMAALKEVLQSCGADCRIASCNDSAAVQLDQVESFILSGCDVLMVHPSDASTLEELCARARSEGIKVMCWDDPMENTDVNWILNNRELGLEIGRMAGCFIDEHYSAQVPADVIVVGHPQTRALLERANGIVEGLEETAAGKYEIVASLSALIPTEALSAVEIALSVHPNARVVVGTGAGPMLGADAAMNLACGGVIPDDMGVFSADVTRLQLEHLEDPSYPARGMVGYEGSDLDTARCCAALFARLLRGEIDTQNIFRPLLPLTGDVPAKIKNEMM